MKKEQLLDLTRRVGTITGSNIPIIVGSQALFAVTEDVPGSVRESIECDYLLASAEAIRTVIKELGLFSEFQNSTGYFADALGLATVVLPPGWEARLQPLQTRTVTCAPAAWSYTTRA